MSKSYQNHIGGKWVDAISGEIFENRNPANWDEVLGTFPSSGAAEVAAAVKSAHEAFDAWRLTPAPERGDILRRVGDIMTERKKDIAMNMTREMGKVLSN